MASGKHKSKGSLLSATSMHVCVHIDLCLCVILPTFGYFQKPLFWCPQALLLGFFVRQAKSKSNASLKLLGNLRVKKGGLQSSVESYTLPPSGKMGHCSL